MSIVHTMSANVGRGCVAHSVIDFKVARFISVGNSPNNIGNARIILLLIFNLNKSGNTLRLTIVYVSAERSLLRFFLKSQNLPSWLISLESSIMKSLITNRCRRIKGIRRRETAIEKHDFVFGSLRSGGKLTNFIWFLTSLSFSKKFWNYQYLVDLY